MRELIQLDLLNNPVVNTDDYRKTIFSMFPSLVVLDTLDKNGIDQEKASLDISAARIPDNLFDKSKQGFSSSNLFSSSVKPAAKKAKVNNDSSAPAKKAAVVSQPAQAPVKK